MQTLEKNEKKKNVQSQGTTIDLNDIDIVF